MVEYQKLYSTQAYFTDKKSRVANNDSFGKNNRAASISKLVFFFQGFVDKGEFYEFREYCLLKCHCPWDF